MGVPVEREAGMASCHPPAWELESGAKKIAPRKQTRSVMTSVILTSLLFVPLFLMHCDQAVLDLLYSRGPPDHPTSIVMTLES